MKKIGYVDYFLDEYHAHRAFRSISSLNEQNGTDYAVTHVFAEIDKENGLSTLDFCQKYGVSNCSSIEELTKNVDYVIIFAPDNPEKKVDYAREVFKAKKPTFIDKTFAKDYNSAKEIFDLAKINGAKFFSSSALRYADELEGFNGEVDSILALGSGADLDGYIVHYLEIIVKCMGTGIKNVCYSYRGDQEWADINYADGRKATALIATGGEYLGFFVCSSMGGKSASLPISSNIFENQMKDVLRFFESGKTSFDGVETLEIMKVRDAVLKSKRLNGALVEL